MTLTAGHKLPTLFWHCTCLHRLALDQCMWLALHCILRRQQRIFDPLTRKDSSCAPSLHQANRTFWEEYRETVPVFDIIIDDGADSLAHPRDGGQCLRHTLTLRADALGTHSR